MDNFLVLVANASKANFYVLKLQNSNTIFSLKNVFVHPESQEKRSELIADRPGHYQSDYGTGGAYEYRSDPKKVEKINLLRSWVIISMRPYTMARN